MLYFHIFLHQDYRLFCLSCLGSGCKVDGRDKLMELFMIAQYIIQYLRY